MKKIIILAVMSMTFFNVSLLANMDDGVKKQCQHNIYGNGSDSMFYSGLMIGVIDGIFYITPKEELEEFVKKANNGTIMDKACQNALNNISQSGFYNDYKWESTKLISKKY